MRTQRTPADITREAGECAVALNELGKWNEDLQHKVRTLTTLITELYNPTNIKILSSCSEQDRAAALKKMDKAFQKKADQINRKFGKPEIFNSKMTWFKTFFFKAPPLISSLKSLYAEAKKHCLAEIKTQQTQKKGVPKDPETDIKNAFKKKIQDYLERVAPKLGKIESKSDLKPYLNDLSQHFGIMKDQQAINQMGTICLAQFLLRELDKKGATIESVFGGDLKMKRMELMKQHHLTEGPNCGFFSRIQFGEIRSSKFKSIIADAQEFIKANPNPSPNNRG